MNNKNIVLLLLIFIAGFVLRIAYLDTKPLWIDEVIFVNISNRGPLGWNQEIIPCAVQYLFSPSSEFWIRFQFAMAGTLSILAIYFISRNKNFGLLYAVLMATFPLFVFWSTLARPYVFAGLFVILSWKYRWLISLAILTTPISIIGTPIIKPKKNSDYIYYASIILLCFFFFILRQDIDKNFLNKDFIINARGIYYIPAICCIMYFDKYVLCKLQHWYTKTTIRKTK